MKQINIFVNHPFENEIKYTLLLMEDLLDCQFKFVNQSGSEILNIDESGNSHIPVSSANFRMLITGQTRWQSYFVNEKPSMMEGKPDYIFSIFYMVNSFQEYNMSNLDPYDRVRAIDLWQHHFDLFRRNVVGDWIRKFASEYLSFLFVRSKELKSRIFLSHDIDSAYGSITQDSFYCLKRFRFGDMLKVLADNIFCRPAWFNMDRIMKMENEYDLRSTFFWITTQSKGRFNLTNADYDVSSSKALTTIRKISSNGWTNGLHKSAANLSFKEELDGFPEKVESNRYHYLLFNLPVGYEQLAESGLNFDSSLGLAGVMGFRNSYSLPFKPYNLSSRKTFGFVECPLHIMDTTYHFYNKFGAEKLTEDAIAFMESNSCNSVITVLFHNNYISDYKFIDYLKAYKKLLSYFYESGFKSISPREITKTFLREY